MTKIATERTNEDWIAALSGGADYEAALTDLRAILTRGLTFSLASRIDQDLEAAVDDFAQDALLKILDKFDTFRGESKFTTWAQKVAVRVAFSEMRRQRWRDVSLDGLTEREDGSIFMPAFLADDAPSPEDVATQQQMVSLVKKIIDEELTPRQREAMNHLMLSGMPVELVAEKMGTNRNALYKLLHDARLRLKKGLEKRNLSAAEMLAEFE